MPPTPEIQTLYQKKKRRPAPPPKPPIGGRRSPAPEIQQGLPKPQLEPRREPPVPILQQYGFHGTLNDFTGRLRMATAAHENAFGFKPTPGLAFDLARSDVPIEKFGDLFLGPRSKKGSMFIGENPDAFRSPKQIKEQRFLDLKQAVDSGNFDKWISQPENWAEFKQMSVSKDPNERAIAVNVMTTVPQQEYEQYKRDQLAVKQAGLFSGVLGAHILRSRNPIWVPVKVWLGASSALTQSPVWLGSFVEGGALDVKDMINPRASLPVGGERAKAKHRVGTQLKGAVVAEKQYYGKLIHDPGHFLAEPTQAVLDGFALATGGAAVMGRAGALSKVPGKRAAMRAAEKEAPATGSSWVTDPSGGKIFQAGRGKTVKTAKQASWEKDFNETAQKVHLAEKNHPLEPEAAKIQAKGIKTREDRNAFSRARGHTEQEITDYNKYHDLLAKGKKLGYTQTEIMQLDNIARSGSVIPPEVLPSYWDALKKPVPQEYIMKKGDQTAIFPLSTNPLVEAVQKFRYGKMQETITARHEAAEAGVPNSADGMMGGHFQFALDWVHDNFSPEAKFGKRLTAVARGNEIINNTLKRELEAQAGRSMASSRVFGRLPTGITRGLTLGEQKAIQVLAIDSPTWQAAIKDYRDFHTWALGAGEGIVREHERHMVALDAAEKVLSNPAPSARWVKTLELTRKAIAEQERIKIEDFGMDAETALGRVVNYARILRGETAYPGMSGQHHIESEIKLREDLLAGKGGGTRSPKEIEADIIAIEKEQSRADQGLPKVAPRTPKRIGKNKYESSIKGYHLERFSDVRKVQMHGFPEIAGKSKVIRYELIRTGSKERFGHIQYVVDKKGELSSGKPSVFVADLVVYPQKALGNTLAVKDLLDMAAQHGLPISGNTDLPKLKQVVARYNQRIVRAKPLTKEGQAKRVGDAAARKSAEGSGYGYFSLDSPVKDPRIVKLEAELADASTKHVPAPTTKRETKKVEEDLAMWKGALDLVKTPEKLNPDSFYFPSQRKQYLTRGLRGRRAKNSGSPFGVPPVQNLVPELGYELSGSSMVMGDFRIDVANVAAETYGRVVRALTVRHQWDQMWKASTAQKGSERDIPIRDIKNIPPELRRVMLKIDEGAIDSRDAALMPKDTQELLKELYPIKGSPEYDKLVAEGNVRWIDPAVIGKIHRPAVADTAAAPIISFLDGVNAPLRFATLYGRPAYALNFLSNIGMAVFAQGIHTGPNMYRAFHSKTLYGQTASDTLRTLVGEGRSKSYIANETGFSRVGGKGARFWSRITDEDMRTSAIIHRLREKNFDIKKLNEPQKMTQADKDLVSIAAERANKDMVQFDNLLPIEKEVLRHIIFVYPWVSRSFVWSLRTAMEHPIKTAVLAEMGKIVEQTNENDPFFKYAPEWYKRTGYTPIGWDGGNPIVVNPTTINTFATMGQLTSIAEGSFLQHVPFSSFEDTMGPAGKFLIHGFTGKDEFGNDYPDANFIGAAKEVLLALPQARAAGAGRKTDKPLPGIDPTNINTLVQREHAALKNVVFTPKWQDGLKGFFASWALGGFNPKIYDKDAAVARYWKGRPWQEQLSHNADLQRKALKIQSDLLGVPVPKKVKDLIELNIKRTKEYRIWQNENGRAPNPNNKAEIDIAFFEKEGLITEAQAVVMRNEHQKAVTDSDLSVLNTKLDVLAGGPEYTAWDRDVRQVASFTKGQHKIIERDIEVLKGLGLWDGNKTTPQRLTENEYTDMGRKWLAWDKENMKRRKDIKDTTDTNEKARKSAEYLVWVMETPPLRPGFPSAPQVDTARLHPKTLADLQISHMFQNWRTLGYRDRVLLGGKTPVKQDSIRGWAEYQKVLEKYRKTQPAAERSIAQDQKDALAKLVDNKYPGFAEDYNFSKRRLVDRLATYKAFRESSHKTVWNYLFKQAHTVGLAIDKRGYPETQAKDIWHDWVLQRAAELSTDYPGWGKELQNIQKHKPSFLTSLLSKGSV